MSAVGAIFMLLPIIGSGYLLYNTKLIHSLLPDTYRSNNYFRILLLGLFWLWLCDPLLARSETVAAIIDFWDVSIFSHDIPIVESALVLALAFVMRMVIDFVIPMFLSEAVKHLMHLRILLNKDAEITYYEAARNVSLLMITTSSDKVYVGWVRKMDPPKNDRKWLHFLPIRSGYRDEKKSLHITTDYKSANRYYSELLSKAKDKDLLAKKGIVRPMAVISVKDMVTIQTFSIDVYRKFFSPEAN